MTSKLSSSILSLKFMQNAQHRKQQKEVELERAKVKDEAEWEVPKEVREGWGAASGSSSDVSFEESYLPFLYPALEAAVTEAPVRGRRTYKNGVLVQEEEEAPVTEDANASSAEDAEPRTSTSQSGRTSHTGRPDAISGGSRPRTGLSKPQSGSSKPQSGSTKLQNGSSTPKKKVKQEWQANPQVLAGTAAPAKTVQDLLRENIGIGVDLRGARAVPSPPVFLKPSGVDEPSRPAPAASASTSASTPTSASAPASAPTPMSTSTAIKSEATSIKTEDSHPALPSGKPAKKVKRKSDTDGDSAKPKKKKRKAPIEG